jgi:hypothetical protein
MMIEVSGSGRPKNIWIRWDPDPDPLKNAILYVGWSLNATTTIFEDLIDYTFFDW